MSVARDLLDWTMKKVLGGIFGVTMDSVSVAGPEPADPWCEDMYVPTAAIMPLRRAGLWWVSVAAIKLHDEKYGLESIKGIGPVYARKIREAITELEERGN